jgi:hypothetical protein
MLASYISEARTRIQKVKPASCWLHIGPGAPEPRGQRGKLPPLPKQCGGGTGETGCPFSPELRFEICALFT